MTIHWGRKKPKNPEKLISGKASDAFKFKFKILKYLVVLSLNSV